MIAKVREKEINRADSRNQRAIDGGPPTVLPFYVFHCSDAEVLFNKDINSLLFNTPLMLHNGIDLCVLRNIFEPQK